MSYPATPPAPPTDGSTDGTTQEPFALRLPAHQVSPRAVGYWRLRAFITAGVVAIGFGIAWALWTDRPWWFTLLAVVLVLLDVAYALVMPSVRFRVHRWEVTDDAVHTRAGWISIDERIAPLSRVQTVDSSQGLMQRGFGLRSLTVTTASAAGPISIECLDAGLAQQLVADLTAITSRTTDDAT
ncbi:PH domain-containing protein [Nocardioides zeae]|uniref:PH domain-containing protein n=1 Tax=Nocardioides imazamoxiresistens TaxID=3231893 RepID=A0ABU3PQI2_9ACTN|nr:PH domain-containing protein [Nocardioides zeae]MDT9591483.1 PH domain-containing protein [Nocardioides zeae]